jgi:hypothetical protein
LKGGGSARSAEDLAAFAVYSGVAVGHHPRMSDETTKKILTELRQIRIGVVFLIGATVGLSIWLHYFR